MMIGAVRCCVNLPPPSTQASSHPSIPSVTAQVTWRRNEESWKRQCMVGAASMTIGLGIGIMSINLHCNETHNAIIATEGPKNPNSELTELLLPIDQRWSQKRSCPAWRMNSFELTVPENLPRPYARRRSESVHSGIASSRSAPSVQFTAKSNPNCFSM